MKLRTRSALTGLALVLPMVVGCLIFYAAAFLLVATDAAAWGVGGSRAWVGLENFRELMGNSQFTLACRNTARFLLIGLPVLLAVAYAAALLLRRFSQRFRVVKSVLMLPYVMPVVGTVSLVEAIFAEEGLLNWVVSALNLPVQDWLNSPVAFWAAMALFLWKNTGYGVILLLSGLIAIDEDQYEAARLDGATGWQQLRYITVPQMWYSVFFCAVFSMINAFKCFREILLLGGDHPHDSIYMLQHFINNTFENMNYPKLAAASILLLIVMTGVYAVCYRWVLRKEAFRE